ncbi:NDP-hexose 2,3-dehydratase family protein [Streptomyces sp. NPDC052101]|uniref:NDP-hexose 2,3-dehydratase family protein n=1 Tax=Streptomyces sp. NPDC052101 TaxID=3155763 RepID=UPI00343E5CBD
MLSTDTVMELQCFHTWFADHAHRNAAHIRPIPFAELSNWKFEDTTGNLVHDSGRFFSVRGLRVRTGRHPDRPWSQPIIDQSEIGILGILVKEFDGVLHCLMQAKMEPGNCNGFQLSPTVQATRSNYSGVHGGRQVPYVEYFRMPFAHRVLADVLQSEQGSWFYRKRNRNMVVEVTDDIEVRDGFCWLSVGQLHELLSVDDLINMDARSVLACLPVAGAALTGVRGFEGEPFRSALLDSFDEDRGALHDAGHIRSLLADARVRHEVDACLVGLDEIQGWKMSADRLSHESGRYFEVMAVDVRTGSREIRGWTQPMIRSRGQGLAAFLVKRIGGVLHALVNVKAEPGFVDGVELAPTVQCTPDDHEGTPASSRPRFLDEVLQAPAESIRFDTVLSDEGGRFFHTRSRHLVVEVEADGDLTVPDDFCWLTAQQLNALMRHCHYVNIQARSLTACLQSLLREPGRS